MLPPISCSHRFHVVATDFKSVATKGKPVAMDDKNNKTTMHTPHNKTYLFVHIIWSVKSRVPLLKKEIRKVLFPHIKQNAERNEIKILIINGIEDHVHCLLQMHPSQNLSQIIKSIKGESSHWINENNFLSETFHWQDGYAAYTVSPSAVDRVLDYIYNQEEHHKKKSLEEELEVLDKIKISV